MGKKRINVGLFTSAYSYFLYLLIKEYNKNDFIIVHASFPKEISNNIHPTIMPFVAFKYGAKMAPTNSLKGISTLSLIIYNLSLIMKVYIFFDIIFELILSGKVI